MKAFKKSSTRFYLSLLLFAINVTMSEVNGQASPPKVVPPSPEASNLFRFQDYPMDYSTGLPQISIPIYEVKSGSLTVPISISYHASGRRVSDQDGPIALGWSLNAGGIISRTIYGSADFGAPDYATYYFPYPFSPTTRTLQDLEKAFHWDDPSANIKPWTDTEYDLFSYSFNNNSGKFIFKDNNAVKTAATIPYRPYNITPTYTALGLSKITIVDDKGITYEFSANETAGSGSGGAMTSLSLTHITSADKTDEIIFKYTGQIQWDRSFSQTRTIIDAFHYDDPLVGPSQYPNQQDLDYVNESTNQGYYQIQRLTEIDFKQGKVMFNLVAGTARIDNIQVFNTSNEVIKNIKFNTSILDRQSDGGSSGNSLQAQVNNKLDEIVFNDKKGVATERYAFEYFPTKYYSNQTTVDLHYKDWWGFYNASGQGNLIPDYTIPYIPFNQVQEQVSIGGGNYNREPSLEALKSGVIKRIIYPTGGSTEFVYENNKYFDAIANTTKNGPGLRVSEIKSGDNNGLISRKTFEYGQGQLDLTPSITTMASETNVQFYAWGQAPPLKYRQRVFYSDFISELSPLYQKPVTYSEVTEYYGTKDNNIGKTVYTYDDNVSVGAAVSMPYFSSLTIPKMHIYNWNYWNMPSLITKTDFQLKQSAAGSTYVPKKLTVNSYSLLNLDDISGMHVQRLKSFPYTAAFLAAATPGNIEQIASQNNETNLYASGEYRISVGSKNLSSTTEKNYNDDGSTIENITTYQYNNKQLVSETTRKRSDGSLSVTDVKYPFDYTNNSVLTQMTSSLNMLNFPIEQIESKGGSVPIKSVRTNYLNWGGTSPMIAPATIEEKKGANAYETKLRYYGYDNTGNPLSVSKENDIISSYIWGYNGVYPTAEVKNAKSNEIFFDSFEEGTGWNSNLTAYDNTFSHCGTYSGLVDKSTAGEIASLSTKWLNVSFSASTKFKYSAWIYSNGPSADLYLYMKRAGETQAYTYTDYVTTTTVGKWVLVEKEFTVPADVTQIGIRIDNNGGGKVWFDDIRVHPSAAQMSSYTYNSLIGITSQTDANNKTTYYEYDDYNRLRLIRDFNRNILKTFNYQLQNN